MVLLLLSYIVGCSAAWTFRIAASTNTRVPGQSFNFHAFGSLGVAADDAVFFLGYANGRDFAGVYQEDVPPDGTLKVIADSTTDIPPAGALNISSRASKFEYFRLGSSCSTTLEKVSVFVGGSYVNYDEGIYELDLDAIVDRRTPIPGSSAKFVDFLDPSLNTDDGPVDWRNAVAFIGRVDNAGVAEEMILLSEEIPAGRKLSILVDYNSVIPNSPGLKFTLLSGSVIVADLTVFFGSNFVKGGCRGLLSDECKSNSTSNGPWPGIYLYQPNGELFKLVDSTDAAPDGGLFVAFSAPSFDGETVGFMASTNQGARGLYLYSLKDKKSYLIATTGTPVPGSSVVFESFPHIPSIKDETAFFYGSCAPPNAAYGGVYQAHIDRDGQGKFVKISLSKVVTKQDSIEGWSVYLISSSWDAWNGKNVAFFTSLKKGSSQIEAVIVGAQS